MEDFIVQCFEQNPNIFFLSLFFLCLICWFLFTNRKKLKEFFDDLYVQRKNKENLLNAIHENQTNIRQIMENRLLDREQSFAIQRELTNAQKELSDSIHIIFKKLDDMQRSTDERFSESERKNNKRIRAELKDKISQSYRYYHSLGKINDMELEALEDLIEEYESVEGKNSFVHSVVQKEMYTWEKVERI